MGDTKIDQEWEHRVLCSDESCIGTIGADGCCRECGRAYEGLLPDDFHDAQATPESPSIIEAQADTLDKSDSDDATTEAVDEDADPDDAWARRILCIDENCIGVVDELTGCCKECGKPYPKGSL